MVVGERREEWRLKRVTQKGELWSKGIEGRNGGQRGR